MKKWKTSVASMQRLAREILSNIHINYSTYILQDFLEFSSARICLYASLNLQNKIPTTSTIITTYAKVTICLPDLVDFSTVCFFSYTFAAFSIRVSLLPCCYVLIHSVI